MNATRPSYAMVRTLILGSATLAIVGVLFAVYQSAQDAPPPALHARHRPIPEDLLPTSIASDSTASGALSVNVGRNIALEKGSTGNITFYEAEGDRPTATLSYQAWEPTGDIEDQFRVDQPRIELRTPNGQLVEIRAESGLVQLKEGQSGKPDLRRGKLTGEVVILIDRLNDEQRQALPEGERLHPTPDRLITITLEELDFDRDYARVTSPGRFKLESIEAVVSGTGLSLRYNDSDSSIDKLEIKRDGQIRLRGFGDRFNVALPGTDEVIEQEEEPELLVATPEPARPPTRTHDDDIPVLPLGVDKPKRQRQIVRYHAAFAGDVRVQQLDGERLVTEMLSDVLELVFDFGPKERQAVRDRSVPAESTSVDRPTETAGTADSLGGEIVVDWTGPLVVQAIEKRKPPARTEQPEADREPLVITASGQIVRLRQPGQDSVSCRRLIYRQESEQALIFGSPNEPAVVRGQDGAFLEGVELALDMKRGTAHIKGPGRMGGKNAGGIDSGSDGGRYIQIAFAQEVNATFAITTVESYDEASGQTVYKQRKYLNSAVLTGDVDIAQGADAISGQRVELTFGPPRTEGAMGDNLQRLQGEGDMVLAHGEEVVRCHRIDIEMGLDEGGKMAPRLARAYRNVTARQGQRTITAADHMVVTLRSFRVEKTPWNLAAARVEATRRGLDVEAIDWSAVQTRYESTDKFRPGILRLEAFGGVTVDDPVQPLAVTADSLDCTFRDGQTLEKAHIVGNDSSPAHVELEDYSVTGKEIDLNIPADTADVPGRGRLTFKSQRDLDGGRLSKPMPVIVTWTERMAYRGMSNQATITGKVHAATADSTFDCGELTIHFAESNAAQRADRSPKVNWWILAPLIERVAGLRETSRTGPKLEGEFNKEPSYLVAAGGAVALTTKKARGTGRVLSRGRVAGPKILVDLRAEAMTVEDAGTLLIEDYELPARRTDSAGGDRPVRTPFGGMGAQSPSQTFLTWQGQMAYYYGRQAAFFEDSVEMVHRSGMQILLGREVVGDAAYTSAVQAGVQEGRQASLTCEQLFVQFDAPADRAGSGGAGQMSAFELSRFEASDRVHFQDSGISVLAAKVTYDAARNWLTLRGTAGQRAAIYDQRNGRFQEIKGEVIEWNRATGQIYVPRASMVAR